MSILKGLGKGILNIFMIPVFLVGLAITSVCGLFIFAIQCFRKVILFFTGRNLGIELEEDVEGAKRLEERFDGANAAPRPQVVAAEFADANFREVPPQPTYNSNQISNSEDIDFLVDQSFNKVEPKQVDIKNQNSAPLVENVQQPQPEERFPFEEGEEIVKPVETKVEPQEVQQEEPTEYNPLTSKF